MPVFDSRAEEESAFVRKDGISGAGQCGAARCLRNRAGRRLSSEACTARSLAEAPVRRTSDATEQQASDRTPYFYHRIRPYDSKMSPSAPAGKADGWRGRCRLPCIPARAVQSPARCCDAAAFRFSRDGVSLRVFDGRLITNRVGAGARVALDHVQRIAVRVARRIEPGLVDQVGDIDHEGVAIPTADGIAHGEIDAVEMRARAGGDDRWSCRYSYMKTTMPGRCRIWIGKRHVADARHAGHHAVHDGVDAGALLFALEGFGQVGDLVFSAISLTSKEAALRVSQIPCRSGLPSGVRGALPASAIG